MSFPEEVSYTLREIVPFLHGNKDVLDTLLGDFEILKKQVRNGSKDAYTTAKLFTEASKRDLLHVFHPDKFSQKDKVIAAKLHQICSCINDIREMVDARHSVMNG